MNKQLAYSGITAKIRAMSKSLITPQMYDEIINLPTVTDFAAYLKNNTTYGEQFGDMDETLLHRGQIERLLANSLYQDFISIYLFASQSQRTFLSSYFKTFEISLIQKFLRLVCSADKNTPDSITCDDFFMRHSRLNLVKMREAKNLPALIDSLSGTEYYGLLQRHLTEDTINGFNLDIILDQYYFKSLWKDLTKKLPPSISDSLKPIYGTKIDLLNIQWIYRGRFHYDFSSGRLLNLVIPVTYRLKASDITNLLEAASAEEFNSLCRKSCYFRQYNIQDVSQLDRIYQDLMHTLCNREAAKDPYSITAVYAYIINKEYELKMLTRILECIRYRLEPSQIQEYLNGGLHK